MPCMSVQEEDYSRESNEDDIGLERRETQTAMSSNNFYKLLEMKNVSYDPLKKPSITNHKQSESVKRERDMEELKSKKDTLIQQQFNNKIQSRNNSLLLDSQTKQNKKFRTMENTRKVMTKTQLIPSVSTNIMVSSNVHKIPILNQP